MRGIERITAGLPALTHRVREALFTRERTRALSDEALLRELEQNAHAVSADGEIDTTSSEAQVGRATTSQEMEKRLVRCNNRLYFEVSRGDPSKVGIYHIEDRRLRHVCGMENGWMPEFSIRHFQEIRLPSPSIEGEWITRRTFTKETRGWRTVLARLLREKLITSSQIEAGWKVSRGRTSEKWQRATSTPIEIGA